MRYPEETKLFLKPVPATDYDFFSSEGELLIAWGIFNPYGPTLSTLLLMRMARLPGRFLGYAGLHQLSQKRFVLGRIRDEDFSPQTLVSMVSAAFLQNRFGGKDEEDGDGVWLMHETGLPTFLDVPYEDEVFRKAVPGMLASNPVLATYDFNRDVVLFSKYLGRPWDRVKNEIFDYMEMRLREKRGESSTSEHSERSRAGFAEWLDIMNDGEHKYPEILAFARAWMEAERSGSSRAILSSSYSFERLNAFLCRYGYGVFRDNGFPVAEVQAGNRPGPPSWFASLGQLFSLGWSLIRKR